MNQKKHRKSKWQKWDKKDPKPHSSQGYQNALQNRLEIKANKHRRKKRREA